MNCKSKPHLSFARRIWWISSQRGDKPHIGSGYFHVACQFAKIEWERK